MFLETSHLATCSSSLQFQWLFLTSLQVNINTKIKNSSELYLTLSFWLSPIYLYLAIILYIKKKNQSGETERKWKFWTLHLNLGSMGHLVSSSQNVMRINTHNVSFPSQCSVTYVWAHITCPIKMALMQVHMLFFRCRLNSGIATISNFCNLTGSTEDAMFQNDDW